MIENNLRHMYSDSMQKLDKIAIAIFAGVVVAAIICIMMGYLGQKKPVIFDTPPTLKMSPRDETHPKPDFNQYPPDASTVSDAK